jgi:hypothetical protein
MMAERNRPNPVRQHYERPVTNAEKRRRVWQALNECRNEKISLTNDEIARKCGVSASLVATVRHKYEAQLARAPLLVQVWRTSTRAEQAELIENEIVPMIALALIGQWGRGLHPSMDMDQRRRIAEDVDERRRNFGWIWGQMDPSCHPAC